MVAKLVAGTCILALVAASESALSRVERTAARPVVVRASLPLPFGVERGYASFSSTWGDTRWHFAATWSGGRTRDRLSVFLASERARD
jgi:hypothetical protein